MLLPIAVIISTGLASFFSARALRHMGKESARLANVASANLIMTLRKPWSKPHFKTFLDDAGRGSSFIKREGEIEGFLNRMEVIAMFLEQKTLKEVHVKEIFGSHFKLIKENKSIKIYYNKQRKKNEMVISTQVNTMSTYPQMSFLALPAVSCSF